MVLKSKSVISGNKQLARSRSSDNLPSSQSQVNIQMMSHTLTIREVCGNLNYILIVMEILYTNLHFIIVRVDQNENSSLSFFCTMFIWYMVLLLT
jgi:hypothetical protein